MEGIGKLIELLNEFEDYNKNCEWGKQYNYYPYRKRYDGDFEKDLTENCMNIVFVISKTFGFIKRLVDNDKIDHKLVAKYEKIFGISIISGKEYEIIIMLLTISDTPIDDLILYLK